MFTEAVHTKGTNLKGLTSSLEELVASSWWLL